MRIAAVLVVAIAVLAGGLALTRTGDAPEAGAEIARLRAELAAERSAREQLAAQVARLEGDLASLRDPAPAEASLAAAAGGAAAAPEAGAAAASGDAVADGAPEAPAPGQAWFDANRLAAAGLPERDVADLRRLFEETELERLYLRDQATREGWPPGRLAQQMAALDQRFASVQDDYGEGAYDWFLYAAGRSNRVKVESVLGGSAAAEAGLRPGDLVYAYGGDRMFKPWSLVQSTQGGRLGETVDLEVQRGSDRIHLTVPRGPLGIRIGRDTVEPPPVR